MRKQIGFVTIQGYALTPSVRSKRKPSVAGVMGELERKPSFCRHVPSPQPPVFFRRPAPGMLDQLKKGAKAARDPLGRTQRKDAQVLLTVIASFPIPWDEFEPTDQELLDRWVRLTIAWVDQQWPGNVAAVVMHVDEPRPHLHILAHNGGKSIKPLHPGHRAKKGYKGAMKTMQTHFHQHVGGPCGFTRNGETPAIRKAGSVGDYKRYIAARARAGVDEVKEPTRVSSVPKMRPYKIPGKDRW